MKLSLKTAINVLASLLFVVLGTIQAAQAEEVPLDFSVPEANVVLATPAPTQFNSQPSTLNAELPQMDGMNQSPSQQTGVANTNAATVKPMKASENMAKLVALDFSVPDVGSKPAPMPAEFSVAIEPSQPEPTPPPVKAKEQPSPKRSVSPPTTSAIKPPALKPLSGKTRHQKLTALRRAIIGQESGGKFYITNPHSGALGYGQVMPANVRPWSRAALGRELSPAEFLNSPDLQIKVIDYKLGQYFDRALQITGGDEARAVKRVAAIWYSGNPNLYTSTKPQFYKGHPYPSIATYSQQVLWRYRQYLQG